MFRIASRGSVRRKKLFEQGSGRALTRFLRLHFFYNRSDSSRVRRGLNCYSNRLNFMGRASFRDTCITTGRPRGVTSTNLSRMQLRKFTMLGCIKGLKKFYR